MREETTANGPCCETQNPGSSLQTSFYPEESQGVATRWGSPQQALRLVLKQLEGRFSACKYHPIGHCKENLSSHVQPPLPKKKGQVLSFRNLSIIYQNSSFQRSGQMYLVPKGLRRRPRLLYCPCSDWLSALRPFSDCYMALPRRIMTALPAASAVEPSDSPIMPGTVLFPQLAFLEHNKPLWVTDFVMFCSSGRRMLWPGTRQWDRKHS